MTELTAFLTLLFAMLSLMAAGIAVLLVVSMLTGDRAGLVARFRPVAIQLAAAVATTATLGSLYLSEIALYEPCRLCWIQRAFMYPAAGFLIASVATRQRRWAGIAGILALCGLPVSIFHRLEQANVVEGGVCTTAASCATKWVNEFGFITIPTMAGFGFAAIAALVGAAYWYDRRANLEEPGALSPLTTTSD